MTKEERIGSMLDLIEDTVSRGGEIKYVIPWKRKRAIAIRDLRRDTVKMYTATIARCVDDLVAELSTAYTEADYKLVTTLGCLRNKPCIPEDIGFVERDDMPIPGDQLELFDQERKTRRWTKGWALLERGDGDLWMLRKLEDHKNGDRDRGVPIFAKDLYDLAMGLERAGAGPIELKPPIG